MHEIRVLRTEETARHFYPVSMATGDEWLEARIEGKTDYVRSCWRRWAEVTRAAQPNRKRFTCGG